MAKRYVQVYYDFIHSLTPLSAAERGRLFTAMLEYAGQGVAPDLRGNERFVWPQLKSQIDRDNERYEEISQMRSEFGKQGGLAKASSRKQKKHLPANAGKCHQEEDEDKDDNNNKDEEEDDSKKKTHYNSAWRTSARARSAVAQNLIDGWETVTDDATGLVGIDANRILCEFMEAGVPPDQIAEVLKNAPFRAFWRITCSRKPCIWALWLRTVICGLRGMTYEP